MNKKEKLSSFDTHAPILSRLRDFHWYWNSTTSNSSSSHLEEETWRKYTDVENEIIEDAFISKKTHVEIDDNIIINLKDQCQYKKENDYRRFSIKRFIETNDNRQNIHSRKERFTFPITLASPSQTPSRKIFKNDALFWLRTGHFSRAYFQLELEEENKTMVDIVEEAAQGIIKEGIALEKQHTAEWLAKQLLDMKSKIRNEKIEITTKIPLEIGETCVNLYTRDSFWFKLINHILRQPATITLQQVKTLGSFCYLLHNYLHENYGSDIVTLYRGLTITDDERQEFMKDSIRFTSFTSTSQNKNVAEMFGGNTLLILDLNGDYEDGVKAHCGAGISHLSQFPDEEEFLIWPMTDFDFIKYEYDNEKNKHLIFLKSSGSNFTTV